MKHEQAIKIVRKASEYYIQKKLAFDANLFRKGLCDTEHAKNCNHEREKVLEALATLANQPRLM